MVELIGKVSEREDRNTEIVCSSLKPVDEEYLADVLEPERLKIRVSSIGGADFMTAQKIMERFSGDCGVLIYCRDNGKRLLAPERLNVRRDERMISELKRVLGENNVKFE